MQLAVYSMKCRVCSAECAVCNMQLIVYKIVKHSTFLRSSILALLILLLLLSPGVAGAFHYTPLSFIHTFIQSAIFFLGGGDKVVKLVIGGSVINGAYPV